MRLLPAAARSKAARSMAVRSMAVLVLVAACGAGTATPAPSAPSASSAPSAPPAGGGAPATMADLDARVFIVTAADGQAIVEGSEIVLSFEDGRLGISAGCNQMGGGYGLDEAGVLTVGQLMMTEMACAEPLMAQDTWIAGFVNGAALTLDGDMLTLARDGVTLTATDKAVARPDLPLEGTTWTIDGLISNQAVSSMPAGITATLRFADGMVDVATGCNTGSGPAELGETSITFGPVGTTKVACTDGAASAAEAHILQVLGGDVSFEIDSDALTLNGAGGGLTARGS